MSPRFVAWFAPLAALAALTCKDATGVDTRVAATVRVSPDSVSIRVGHTLQMRAVAIDSAGDTLTLRTPTWASSDTTIVAVSATGLATARTYGPVTITATVDSVAGSAVLRVLVPVAEVSVEPYSVTLVPGGTLKMTAVLEGTEGSTLSDRDVAWNHQASVSIAPGGMIKGVQTGRDSITATSEGVASWNHAIATVTQPTFVRIASGEWSSHTCTIAADGRAFCWGGNASGTLGNGTFGDSLGGNGGLAYPTGVIDITNVASIATGSGMTCAVTGDFGHPYCWGFNGESQIGVPGTDARSRPTHLITTLTATAVVAGSEWGCFLATDSLPYCWGGNTTRTVTPLPATGGRKYVTIAAGYNTLCGIGIDSLAYCGLPLANHTLVSPTLKFTTLSVGYFYTCGIATDSTAYCWGANDTGQLGDGTRTGRSAPGPVSGGMKFVDIAAGDLTTCGIIAPSSMAYCWGLRRDGFLGPDTAGVSVVPVQVSGNVAFSQLTIGDYHACGISSAGKAYCWGSNRFGQLGDGTTITRFAPVLVAGQAP